MIATGGGTVSALAAKNATATIPVVFVCDDDPVKVGLVSSISRPGGNVTGIYQLTTGLEAKRLALLHELVPNVTIMAVLVNPDYPDAETQIKEIEEAARTLRLQFHILKARTKIDLRLRSQRSCDSGPARSSSLPTPSCLAGVSNWSRWRLTMRYPRSISFARTP